MHFTISYINGKESINKNLQLTVGEIITSLFWHVPRGTSPWAFHLWFLRDLIIIVAISPLLYYVRKAIRGSVLTFVLFLLSFFQFEVVPVYALFWFMAGDAFLVKLDKVNTYWIPAVFIVLSVLELAFPELPWKQVRIPIIALGIVSIWNLYNRIVPITFEFKKHKYKIRVFQCPDCGSKTYAAKSAGRMTAPGHMKYLWCAHCKEVKNMTQIDKI